MTNCTHATAIIYHTTPQYQIMRCTWGCGEFLISHDLPNGISRTATVTELIAAASPTPSSPVVSSSSRGDDAPTGGR